MAATLPNPSPSLFGAIKNIGRGLFDRTAKFAGYGAAVPTATTAQGSRIGTNPNSTFASVQRVGMQFTAEMVAKNSAIGAAYLAQRVNYCSSSIDYVPHTGDTGLDREIKQFLQGSDGVGGYFSTMGVDCSMQDAFSRTADIETPVRGDAGLIFWRDALDNLRLIEFSADQLGEVYQFTMPRPCSLSRDAVGQLYESSGSDCIYFAGRYFRGADCVAYRIYERTNAWYGNPQIYDADDVIYFRDPASFRGVRGVTKFANALQHMQKGEDMLQAALSAAQRQARTAGRVFNNSGGPASGYGSEIVQGDPNLGGDMIKYFEREPGGPMVEYFYNGDNAEFVNPTAPGPELIAGVETSDERVAISLGLNYAFLISATKVGGAPSRLEIEKADKELNRIQRTIHRPRLNIIRDRVLMDALHRGIIRKPFGMTKEQFLRGNWQLPISPSVDAFYDAKENISMVRAGMEAAQDVIAETNRNWEDVLEKNAQWAMKCSMVRQDANKMLIAAGYKPDITPADIAQVSDNPQQSAAAENIEQGKPAAGGSPTPATAQQTAQLAEHDVSDEKRDGSGRWTGGGGSSAKKDGPVKSDGKKSDIDSKISSVRDGNGSMEFFHGTRMKNADLHIGKTFADNQQTADNYASDKTFQGNVDISGLKIARVKRFDRDDPNYGAVGDTDDDIADLQDRGIDLIEYDDEDPNNKEHTAYRIVSDKALGRFKDGVSLRDNRIHSLAENLSENELLGKSKDEVLDKIKSLSVEEVFKMAVDHEPDHDEKFVAQIFKDAGVKLAAKTK